MAITPPPGARATIIAPPPPPPSPSTTEQRVMRTFVLDHEDRLRFNHDRGKWMIWKQHYWQLDGRRRAFYWALEYCFKLGTKKAERIGFASAIETGARSMASLATCTADWNPSLTLVACPDGVIDLETGVLRDGRPEDMIDRCLAISPHADPFSQVWHDFLMTMFAGNTEIIDFLQRWCGYCLSGIISEQKFLFLHGTGANGKGTLLNTLASIWGELCTTASIDTFLEQQFDRHTQDLAKLNGPHMVQVHETREGRRWDEARIKSLTGGDPITARFMRQDDFTFIPRFKPMFAGNHRPQLRTVDEAMQRRFLLLPCTVTIPADQRDPKLGERLLADGPRILRWAIEGFSHWRRIGLKPPAAVLAATQEYLANQDDLQLWIEEKLQRTQGVRTTDRALYADWAYWQEMRGGSQGAKGTQRGFNDRLRDKGLTSKKSNGRIEFEDVEFSYSAPP